MNDIHPQIKELDYNHIADGIFIGTNQCCQMHFDKALTRDGISADISLEKDRLDAPFGVEFYVWIPVEDHTAPTLDQMKFGVATLDKLAAMEKRVYVHCKNGHGRAPTLVAAYLIKNGRKLDDALALIRSKRPSVHFQDAQIEALKEWEHGLTI